MFRGQIQRMPGFYPMKEIRYAAPEIIVLFGIFSFHPHPGIAVKCIHPNYPFSIYAYKSFRFAV